MDSMTRKKIGESISSELMRFGYSKPSQSAMNSILDEIEQILPKYHKGGLVGAAGSGDKVPALLHRESVLTSEQIKDIEADPRGADRIARTLPEQEFNPLGGASRGIGRCTCAAGPGTNPSCPVHP